MYCKSAHRVKASESFGRRVSNTHFTWLIVSGSLTDIYFNLPNVNTLRENNLTVSGWKKINIYNDYLLLKNQYTVFTEESFQYQSVKLDQHRSSLCPDRIHCIQPCRSICRIIATVFLHSSVLYFVTKIMEFTPQKVLCVRMNMYLGTDHYVVDTE